MPLEPSISRDKIIEAHLNGDALLVCGSNHQTLHVPLSSIPALRDQPDAVLKNFTIDSDGSFIYWPDLDLHLGWNQFLRAVDPAELRKSQQRSTDFNRRYGTAIRRIRETAGISQSDIAGLTDRQVRRIEHGECRATTGALTALAKGHDLDVNDYIGKLADQMSKGD